MSSRTGADRALSHLGLVPGEEVFWIGRPAPHGERPSARGDLAALGAAALILVGMAVAAARDPQLDTALFSTLIAVPVGLGVWFKWANRFERAGEAPGSRYVVTSLRAAIVREQARAAVGGTFALGGLPVRGIEIAFPLQHILAEEVAGASIRGAHVVLHCGRRNPWEDFVLPSPDDPEGALRAVERMLTARSTAAPEPT